MSNEKSIVRNAENELFATDSVELSGHIGATLAEIMEQANSTIGILNVDLRATFPDVDFVDRKLDHTGLFGIKAAYLLESGNPESFHSPEDVVVKHEKIFKVSDAD